MAFPSYAGKLEKTWYYVFRIICGLILFFLMAPIVVLIPLSFNAEPYFTFTQGMLSLDPDAFSIRWYQDFINNPQWIHSIKNSVIIGVFATILATSFGTLAAWGLSLGNHPAAFFCLPLVCLALWRLGRPGLLGLAGMEPGALRGEGLDGAAGRPDGCPQ